MSDDRDVVSYESRVRPASRYVDSGRLPHSALCIASFVCAGLATATVGLAVLVTVTHGRANNYAALFIFLAAFAVSLVGMALGMFGTATSGRRHLYGWLGMLWNGLFFVWCLCASVLGWR